MFKPSRPSILFFSYRLARAPLNSETILVWIPMYLSQEHIMTQSASTVPIIYTKDWLDPQPQLNTTPYPCKIRGCGLQFEQHIDLIVILNRWRRHTRYSTDEINRNIWRCATFSKSWILLLSFVAILFDRYRTSSLRFWIICTRTSEKSGN
jgi:hypothetical protein